MSAVATLYGVDVGTSKVMVRPPGDVWADLASQPSFSGPVSEAIFAGGSLDDIIVHESSKFWHYRNGVWASKADGGATDCYDLFALPNGVAYAALPNGVAKLSQPADTWSRSPTSGLFYGIWAGAEDNVWAVGGSGGAELLYHWDGVSWTNRFSEISSIGGDPGFPADVWGVGGNVYVITNGPTGFVTQRLFRWDGVSWTLLGAAPYYGPSHDGWSVWAAADDAVYCSGVDYTTSNHGIDKWNGSGWAYQHSDGVTFAITNVTGVSADEVYVQGIRSGDKTRIYETTDGGTTWTEQADSLLATRKIADIWAVGPAAGQNFSFEIAGSAAGRAASWDISHSAGAEEIATFEGSTLPYEEFEAGWQGGNQLSLPEFSDSDLEAATFNGSTAVKETFDYGWKRPVHNVKATLSNAGRSAPAYANPNDAFTLNQLYRDLDTGGRAIALSKESTTIVYFTYVDFVNPLVTGINGFLKGSYVAAGARLAILNFIYTSLGTGDGVDRSFSAALQANVHSKQFGRDATFRLYATIGGVKKAFVDDGAGSIIADPDDPNTSSADLNASFAQTIDYATAAVSVVFKEAPDDGTDVYAEYDYGAAVTEVAADADSPLPFVSAIVDLEPSAGDLVPPYNHSQLTSFLPENLEQAQFDSVEQPETFEAGWDSNETSKSVFADADLSQATFDSAAETAEDFEDGWDVSQGGNDASKSSFSPSDLSAATFDSGAAQYEGFEGTWSTVDL